jgi:hypothetical protein
VKVQKLTWEVWVVKPNSLKDLSKFQTGKDGAVHRQAETSHASQDFFRFLEGRKALTQRSQLSCLSDKNSVGQCKHHRFNEFLVVRQESIEQTSK